jgi:hypothetical protein
MIKVFIGGSRAASKLNKDVKRRIDKIIEKSYLILIGDANGADKAVQKYLYERGHKSIVVFCMENQCRNNIGRWQTKHVSAPEGKNGFEYYSAKDLEMAKEADYGFMIWDAKSKGTLNNIIALLKLNKKTLLYFYPDKKFYEITTFDKLKALLSKCSKESLKKLEKDLNLQEILNTTNSDQSSLEFTYEEDTKLENSEKSEVPVVVLER